MDCLVFWQKSYEPTRYSNEKKDIPIVCLVDLLSIRVCLCFSATLLIWLKQRQTKRLASFRQKIKTMNVKLFNYKWKNGQHQLAQKENIRFVNCFQWRAKFHLAVSREFFCANIFFHKQVTSNYVSEQMTPSTGHKLYLSFL